MCSLPNMRTQGWKGTESFAILRLIVYSFSQWTIAYVQLLGLPQGPHVILIMLCAPKPGRVPQLNICAGAIVDGNASIAAALVEIHIVQLGRVV